MVNSINLLIQINKIQGGYSFTGQDAVSLFNILTNRSKNIIFALLPDESKREQINNKENMGQNEKWNVFVVRSLTQAEEILNSVFPSGGITNLLLEGHGKSKDDVSYFEFISTKSTAMEEKEYVSTSITTTLLA